LGPAKDFSKENFSLIEMPVATWGPLLAIQPRPLDPHEKLIEPATQFAPLDQALENTGWQDKQFFSQKTYDINCNWKVFVDNYLDGGYHVSVLHRDLAKDLALENYHTETYVDLVIQSCEGKNHELPPRGPERLGGKAVYGWVYPNFMVNIYGPFWDTNYVLPLGVDKTRVVFDYFCDPALLKNEAFIQKSLKESDQVQQEDIFICESVQKGLGSMSYDKGRYAPKLEMGEHLFHTLLAKDVSATPSGKQQ